MNINANILKYVLIAWGLTVISCDKQETEIRLQEEAVMEEGFMSTTENSDSESEESENGMYPLLHMKYDASLSEDEVEAQFQTDVSKLQKVVNPTTNKDGGRTVFYVIRTRTGSGNNGNTDGRVEAKVNFLSEEGITYSPKLYLDNYGDDREKGQWDIYVFFVKIKVWDSWIKVRQATISLNGRDGWYLSKLKVSIESLYSPYFNWEVNGYSFISEEPRLWLDNKHIGEYAWDSYTTKYLGIGKVEFEYTYPGL